MMFNRYITYTDINSEKKEVKIYIDGNVFTVGLTDFENESIPNSGEIDELMFDIIVRLETKLKCMKKAVKALAYSAHNSSKLKQKLYKDFPRDIVDEIVETLASKNYIDDNYLASRAAESCCYAKLYGPRRIRLHLKSKGYSSSDIDDAISLIPEDDFFNNMDKLQHKKFKSSIDDINNDQLKELFYKYGYTDSQIYEYLQSYR